MAITETVALKKVRATMVEAARELVEDGGLDETVRTLRIELLDMAGGIAPWLNVYTELRPHWEELRSQFARACAAGDVDGILMLNEVIAKGKLLQRSIREANAQNSLDELPEWAEELPVEEFCNPEFASRLKLAREDSDHPQSWIRRLFGK